MPDAGRGEMKTPRRIGRRRGRNASNPQLSDAARDGSPQRRRDLAERGAPGRVHDRVHVRHVPARRGRGLRRNAGVRTERERGSREWRN